MVQGPGFKARESYFGFSIHLFFLKLVCVEFLHNVFERTLTINTFSMNLCWAKINKCQPFVL